MSETVTIFVPLDSASVALGADEVAKEIMQQAVKKGVPINLVRNGSRGLIWAEPLIEVKTATGRVAYGPVDVDDMNSLFDANFLFGGAHPLCLGPTEEIPYLKNQNRVTFTRCGIVDPLSLREYKEHGGLKGLEKVIASPSEDIVGEIEKSGLRGRGGAGFPAGIKWRTVHNAQAGQKYIVCNADEGDAGTFADRMIIEGDPFFLIEGMIIAGLAVGATKGYIYLRSEYPVTKDIISEALAKAYEAGLLGTGILGSGRSFDLELFVGAGSYVCGEETALLESLEGKRGQVRAKPPLPALEGLYGQPTLVHNVISLCAIPTILSEGGSHYHSFGCGRSRGTMPFQLAGNVKYGGIVEKPFGITLRELIEGFGGGTLTGHPFRTAQVGGPLGAYLPERLLDLEMDYEKFAEQGAGIGHGGIIVFDDQVDMAEQAQYAFAFCEQESCGKCTPCRIGAVRGREIMDRFLDEGDDLSDTLLHDLLETMEDGSLCAMGGMTPVPVRSALENFSEDFKAGNRAKL